MQAALEISAYVLGFTILCGMAMVAWLLKDLFWGGGFKVPHPAPGRLPTDSLHEVRAAHKRLRQTYESADAAGRQRLDLHLRRLRERVDHLELKTIEDQSGYYNKVTLQERAWRHWKAVHTQVNAMARGDRQRAQHHLLEAERHFRQLAIQVKDEWEKGIVRDRLNVEELRGLGLLDPDYARTLLRSSEPIPEPAPWDTLPTTAAAPPAPPRSRANDQAAGMLTFRALREIARSAAATFNAATEAASGAAADLAARWRSMDDPAPEDAAASADPVTPPPTGPWHQADLLEPLQPKTGRPYGDNTFSVAELPTGTLTGADLSGATFTAVEFQGIHRHMDVRFIGADLRGIVLGRQERPHQFARCNFAQADLSGARMTFLLFHRCNLTGTRWYGAALDRVKFTECVLNGVDWGGCDLSKTVFTEEAQSADFSTASAMPLFAPPSTPENTGSNGADEPSAEGDSATPDAAVPPAAAAPLAEAAPVATPVPPKE